VVMEQRYHSTRGPSLWEALGGRGPSPGELGSLQGCAGAELPLHGRFPATLGGSCKVSVSQLPLQ